MIIRHYKPTYVKPVTAGEKYAPALIALTGAGMATAICGWLMFESLKADVVAAAGAYALEARGCKEVLLEGESMTTYRGKDTLYLCTKGKEAGK